MRVFSYAAKTWKSHNETKWAWNEIVAFGKLGETCFTEDEENVATITKCIIITLVLTLFHIHRFEADIFEYIKACLNNETLKMKSMNIE